MTVFCPETSTTYPDFAAFEAAEQGAADKTARISGKVAGGAIQGWTGHLTIEADTNPYDGTNSATCDGLNSQLMVRNNNVTFSSSKMIFISEGSVLVDSTLRLGSFEAVTNINGSIGVSNTSTSNNAYAIGTYAGSGGEYNLDVVIVERSGGGVWLRGSAPTSTVNHLLIVDSSAGQAFRGGLHNSAGATVKNALVIPDATAGQPDFNGSSYNAASDWLASNDTSASTFAATTSFTGITTAELVDFAGGDFRIRSNSPLATAGEGGTFIGAFLEVGGTPSVSSDPITSASTITQPILSQSYTLAVDGLLSAHTLSQSTLSQGGSLSSNNLSNDHNVTQSSLTAMAQLSPNALSNDASITEPALTQKNAIASANVSHDNTISEPTLTQGNVLAVNALVSNQSIENVTLVIMGMLPVQSLVNAQDLTQPNLTASNSLAVDGLSNDNQLSISTLIQKHLLSADSLSHDQTLTQPVISVSDTLSVQSILSSQALTDSGLTQHLAIITNNITNTQFIGNVILNGEDQTIGTVTAAFKDNGIGVKYGVTEFTVKFKD